MEENKIYHLNFLDNNLPDKCANLIIADPPYFQVKGEFDFIWKSFDEYLEDVEKWAIECKRILSDNGTLLWYGSAKRIAYAQIIFDKEFNLLNSIVWENTNQAKQSMVNVSEYRSFPPLTERVLMYEQRGQKTGGELIFEQFIKPKNPFSIYLKSEFRKAGLSNREIAKLFPSKTGGLTGCVSNWLNGENVITEDQYLKIRDYTNGNFLLKEYEELRKEYEELRKEYEELRRPFNNYLKYGDVIRIPNYETSNFEHDTIKPEKLTRALILTCSKKDDLVIVPFSGSGTECAMSAKEGRRFIGFDIEEKYVKMGNQRAEQFINQMQIF